MKQQQGFTLIELIVVIVILGILAATALPKFVNLSAEAETAAVKGMVGALKSGAAINKGVVILRPAASAVNAGNPCSGLFWLMDDNTFGDFVVSGDAPNCSVARNGASASAVIAINP